MQERSEAIPLEAPSGECPTATDDGGRLTSSPVPPPAKGLGTLMTKDRDPESDSGLPDHSSDPNQHHHGDMAGAAIESTVSSSPPPVLLRRTDSPSSPRLSRIPVRDPSSPLESPSKDLKFDRRHRWSSPVPGSPTYSPSPSLSYDNLPCILPRDRLPSERGSRSDYGAEDPLSLSSSSGSKSKIPRPLSTTGTSIPKQLPVKFLPRPPPGKPCLDTR